MRNKRHRIPRPLASVTLAMLLALTVMSTYTGTAFAEDRRFYVGVTIPVERLDASYEKTVDNTHPSNRVPSHDAAWCFMMRIPTILSHMGSVCLPAIDYPSLRAVFS